MRRNTVKHLSAVIGSTKIFSLTFILRLDQITNICLLLKSKNTKVILLEY
jgi:hypothetical protein